MTEATQLTQIRPEETSKDALTEVLRTGSQRTLAALEAEVESYPSIKTSATKTAGAWSYATSLGSLPVRRPRVNDRRVDSEGRWITFTSKILPPYLRRTKTIEELLPWLYLRWSGVEQHLFCNSARDGVTRRSPV